MSESDQLSSKSALAQLFARPQSLPHKLFFAALYVASPFLVLYVLYLVDRPYELDDSFRITPSHFVVSFDDAPPQTGWKEFDADSPPKRATGDPFTSVWYQYKTPADIDSPTLYVPFPRANLDIWHAEQRLAKLGPMELPLYYSRFPELRPLPGGVSADVGVLQIRVARSADNSYPPATYVAPFELAQRDFDDQAMTRRWVTVAILIVMSIFIVVNAGLFLLNRRETAYGWYALMMLLWGLHSGHTLVNSIPINHAFWFTLLYLLLFWIVVELIFINRFFSLDAPRLERFVLAVSALVGAITIAGALYGGVDGMQQVVGWVLYPWSVICTILVVSRYFAAIRDEWTLESVSLWLLSGVFLGVGIRDILYENGFNGWWPPGSAYYLQFVAALPMALFGIHLMRRYMNALSLARIKNRELDEKIAERTIALEESYKEIAAEQSRRNLAEERARLMRDMHDGLGGQLVHALALSEQGSDEDLQKALRLALDDLRLVVESLSPEQRGLPELVASYRHRVAKLLSRSGVRVSWEISELEQSTELPPKHALNLLRVLQEAVTNAVRHSGGDLIRVILKEVAEGVMLRIADNGHGITDHQPGHGLNNMRARAREIGMQIDIDTSPNGTTVSCLLVRLSPS